MLYAALVAVLMPRYGGLVLLGALTLGTSLVRLDAAARSGCAASCRSCACAAHFATRERLRELLAFSSSNFLVHVAQKIVFSTDVIVVGIVLGVDRRRRLRRARPSSSRWPSGSAPR